VKLTQYDIIHEGITNIDRWIEENPYAPHDLYQPSNMERNTYFYALDHFQHIGHKVDKEVTKSMVVCSRIHKETQELIRNN